MIDRLNRKMSMEHLGVLIYYTSELLRAAENLQKRYLHKRSYVHPYQFDSHPLGDALDDMERVMGGLDHLMTFGKPKPMVGPNEKEIVQK